MYFDKSQYKQSGNILIFLLIGILVIGGLGGAYYLGTKKSSAPTISPAPVATSQTPQTTPSSTSDETANWKTYNGQFFSFKYPQGWILNEDKITVSLLDPNYGEPNCRGDCPTFTVNIHILDNPKNLSLETTIQNNYKAVAGATGDYSKVKIEDYLAPNGLNFKKVIGVPGGGFYQLYILQNNKIFIVSPGAGVNAMLDDENNPKVKAGLSIFDQILSTFKFTN